MTLYNFHVSGKFYRGVMGPVGSGKSSACVCEIARRIKDQAPQQDGVRRSRWAVIRNTTGQLRDTTLKTWLDWMQPQLYGEPRLNPQIDHIVKENLEDGTSVEAEILFRPLDKIGDITRILSMELTGVWVNEAREVPKGLIDALGDRTGRYPATRDGGCTWRGIIMDTNPPDEDHWWYRLSEEERPPTWDFFKQPGGLIEVENGKFAGNPKAENLAHLEKDYYITRMHGKSPEFIRVYYCAQYGFVQDGRPVIPEYIDSVHCANEILTPVLSLPIYVGVDFGLTPAAIFAQRLANGQWIWFDEIVSEDMGIKNFGENLLGPKMRGEYGGYKFEIYGDPAGAQRSQTDEKTCFQMLQGLGIKVKPAPTNEFTMRREAIAVPMTRLIDGKPGFLLSPRCKKARKGLAGGYRFRRLRVSGDERYHDVPDKNEYSHVIDAGQYAMLGAGEGKVLINRVTPIKKVYPDQFNYSGSWML